MSNFKDELEWYWRKKVYVYPYKSPAENFKWTDWRSVKDFEYEERLRTYLKEDAIGLNIVTGKKGVCGIAIRRDKTDSHSRTIVQEVLKLLCLPKNYPWIIESPDEYTIIVDSINSLSNTDKKRFTNIRIVWEERIQLPAEKNTFYPVRFYSEYYPDTHPIQVYKELVYECIEKIDWKVLLRNKRPWWKVLIKKLF